MSRPAGRRGVWPCRSRANDYSFESVGLEPDPDDSLIAAAEAAASWAHARRAKWTKEPLRVPESASTFSEIEFEFEQESAVVSPPPVAPQPPVAPKPPPVVPPPPPAAPTPSAARPPVFEWPTAVEAEPIAAPVPAPVPTPGRRETPAASARVAGAARGLAEPLRQWRVSQEWPAIRSLRH